MRPGAHPRRLEKYQNIKFRWFIVAESEMLRELAK